MQTDKLTVSSEFRFMTNSAEQFSDKQAGDLAKVIFLWGDNNDLGAGWISQIYTELRNDVCLLAYDGDTPVGYLSMQPIWVEEASGNGVPVQWIKKVMVAPERRHSNLAKQLLALVNESYTRHYLVLTTADSELQALAQRLGYIPPGASIGESFMISMTMSPILAVEGVRDILPAFSYPSAGFPVLVKPPHLAST